MKAFDHRCDVAVIGAGIVGLAHALAAAKRGLAVTVFERETHAVGASVRNFGLGLAVGQAPGDMHELALRSREIWLEILRETASWHKTAGSLMVARDALERAVLEQFQELRGRDYGTRLVTHSDIIEYGLPADAGVGGLFSPSEIAFESRVVMPALTKWLAKHYGVRFVFGAQVHAVESGLVHSSQGSWHAERVFICAGHDFKTLFPAAFAVHKPTCCRLQMLRLHNPGIALLPTLLTGLSCLRYDAFADCPAVPALREHVQKMTPDLLDAGIHLIVQQVGKSGDLIIGDSHDYSDTITPFESESIDNRLLELAEALLDKKLAVRERWQGVYASGPEDYLVIEPLPGVVAVTITAGVGMSISFALAERHLA